MKNKKHFKNILALVISLLLLGIVYAGQLGENNKGDTGTGNENETSGGSNEINNGGRYGGKTEEIRSKLNNTSGGDQRDYNHKTSPPPPPPVVNFINDGITISDYSSSESLNINEQFVRDGKIFAYTIEVQRVQNGKIIESVKMKTEITLKESVEKDQSNHIENGFNNENNQLDNDHKFNRFKGELEGETSNLKNLFVNASDQASDITEKKALENLAALIGVFNKYQEDYANIISESATELSQNENKTIQDSAKLITKSQELNIKPIPLVSSDVGVIERIQQLSMSFVSLIFGGSSDNLIGIAFRKFYDQFSSVDENARRGDPYVKEALQKSSLTNGITGIKSIEPVREKLVKSVRDYLAPDVKIQYSQDRDKRNGPHSFDCSGFVTYVYGQMGLNLTGPYGRAPVVRDIVSKTGMFHQIDESEAQVGDLIVHLGDDSNHVGIYTGKDARGNVKEISATTRKRYAMLPINNSEFKSSIVEHPATHIGKRWTIYRWNK